MRVKFIELHSLQICCMIRKFLASTPVESLLQVETAHDFSHILQVFFLQKASCKLEKVQVGIHTFHGRSTYPPPRNEGVIYDHI